MKYRCTYIYVEDAVYPYNVENWISVHMENRQQDFMSTSASVRFRYCRANVSGESEFTANFFTIGEINDSFE